VGAADRIGAKAIVALAGSGFTALHLSKWRPPWPIVALGSLAGGIRRLNLLRGVSSLAVPDASDFERQLELADAFLLGEGHAVPGDVVVVVAAVPLGAGKETNTIRFHRVQSP
jgi:pyruvate kinase